MIHPSRVVIFRQSALPFGFRLDRQANIAGKHTQLSSLRFVFSYLSPSMLRGSGAGGINDRVRAGKLGNKTLLLCTAIETWGEGIMKAKALTSCT